MLALTLVLAILALIVLGIPSVFLRASRTYKHRWLRVTIRAGFAVSLIFICVLGWILLSPREEVITGSAAVPEIAVGPAETKEALELREWLAHGAAAFNPKDEMKQGEEETIALRISEDPADSQLRNDMPGGKATHRWPQDVSKVMRAELTGDTFKITQLGPPEQLIHDGRFEWNWKVNPLKSGDHELQLVTSIVVPVPSMGTQQSVIHSEYRHVRVHVSPVFVMGHFVAAYWQWIASSIAIPLLGWVWKKQRDGKRAPSVGFEAG